MNNNLQIFKSMKKLIIYISIGAFLSSCGSSVDQEKEQVNKEVESDVNLNTVVLDENEVYSFMDLKDLYAQNWEGEEKGNIAIDGSIVSLKGEIFDVVKKFNFVDGESKLKGVKIAFRGSEFADPDFGHDVECHFSLEQVEEITALTEGANVIVKGIIEKQEVYIEPDLTYTVLSIKSCQLINE